MNWLDRIDEAIKYEASAENTLTKLRRFQERKFFKTRLDECRDALLAAARDEPACDRLLNLTGLFHPKMFEIKGRLEMALTFAAGNYNAHREQARRAIEREYKELTCELEKVIDDLSKKVALENSSPPKHFLPTAERPSEYSAF